jgi:hypothetical protein
MAVCLVHGRNQVVMSSFCPVAYVWYNCGVMACMKGNNAAVLGSEAEGWQCAAGMVVVVGRVLLSYISVPR